MKKLSFLVGQWSGQARMQRGPGEGLELAQTENAQYKLEGLVLLIEGTGRASRWQGGASGSCDDFVRRRDQGVPHARLQRWPLYGD